VTRYYEILLTKNWCSFVIASQKETLPRNAVLADVSPACLSERMAKEMGAAEVEQATQRRRAAPAAIQKSLRIL
jgi:hypothetical protein